MKWDRNSQEDIRAGIHFGFNVTMDEHATIGDREYLYIHSAPAPDDTIIFDVVPEPGTVMLFGIGGLVAFRKRRRMTSGT